MAASVLNRTVKISDRHSLIKSLLYVIFIERGLKVPDNHMNILSLFVTNDNKKEVIGEAVSRKYVQSFQTGENTVSKLVTTGLLVKRGTNKRIVDPDILPLMQTDFIAVTFKIHNLNAEL